MGARHLKHIVPEELGYICLYTIFAFCSCQLFQSKHVLEGYIRGYVMFIYWQVKPVCLSDGQGCITATGTRSCSEYSSTSIGALGCLRCPSFLARPVGLPLLDMRGSFTILDKPVLPLWWARCCMFDTAHVSCVLCHPFPNLSHLMHPSGCVLSERVCNKTWCHSRCLLDWWRLPRPLVKKPPNFCITIRSSRGTIFPGASSPRFLSICAWNLTKPSLRGN